MTVQPGLRERKKQQTRQRIIDAALDLFEERGFDRTPVADIARAADVSEATVFNYFPTKEDLVYDGMETFEARLVDAVRERPTGTTALAAFRDYVLQPRGALTGDDPAMIGRVARIARIITGSAALRAREQQIVDRATDQLAEVLAADSRARAGDIRPWVVANALMGVNRQITRAIHRGAVEGRSGPSIARSVLQQGRRAFDLLEQGVDA